MDNLQFGQLLEKRTKDFAVAIIKFLGNLPDTHESKIIKNQIARSATSVGANYREANRSRSKTEFINLNSA